MSSLTPDMIRRARPDVITLLKPGKGRRFTVDCYAAAKIPGRRAPILLLGKNDEPIKANCEANAIVTAQRWLAKAALRHAMLAKRVKL